MNIYDYFVAFYYQAIQPQSLPWNQQVGFTHLLQFFPFLKLNFIMQN